MQIFELNGREERILKILRQFGFTDYESKAYFTLLLYGKSSAWELGRRAGIPQSKAHETLYSLADKRAVGINEGRPKEFEPVTIQFLVKSYIKRKRWEIVQGFKNGTELMNIVESVKQATDLVRTPFYLFKPRYRKQPEVAGYRRVGVNLPPST